MHSIFLSIANIFDRVHVKATSHAWSCAAFIPIPSCEVHSDFQIQTILQDHIYYECMDIVSVNLKITANQGQMMLDPIPLFAMYLHHSSHG